jgi:hypothetical protein
MIFKQIAEILDGRKTQTRRVVKEGEFPANMYGMYIDERVLNEHNAKYGSVWDLNSQYRQRDYGTCIMTPTSRVKWQIGRKYSIVPKRGAAGIGQFIRITNIRYEHIQDITEADAIAEGVGSVEEYKSLWESINGKTKGARWADNPPVWVLTFKLVTQADSSAQAREGGGG